MKQIMTIFLGMAICTAISANSAILPLYEKNTSDWSVIPGGAWGVLTWNESGLNFDFAFDGHGLVPSTNFTLIYYPDPWPGTGLKVLGSGSTNDDGYIHLSGSPNTGTLPIAGDANAPGAKIWLARAADVDGDHMLVYNPAQYIFEAAKISFPGTSQLGAVTGVVTLTTNGAPVGGVTIDLFDEWDHLLGIATTNANGVYTFTAAIWPYKAEMIVPPGFTTNLSISPLTAAPFIQDFQLTPFAAANDARSKGYWKHQANANGNANSIDYSASQLEDLTLYILQHFYNNSFNPIAMEGVTYVNPAQPLAVSDLQYMLNLGGNAGMLLKAKQQILTLLLNLAAGKISLFTIASYDNATVSQAIVRINQILMTSSEQAKNVAETLNNGQKVAVGVIPLSTPCIIFGDELPLWMTVSSFKFCAASPNPFNPVTTLSFELPQAGLVNLAVYDVSGRQVASVIQGWREAGSHEVTFDAGGLTSGMYLARLEAGGFSAVQKLLLVK